MAEKQAFVPPNLGATLRRRGQVYAERRLATRTGRRANPMGDAIPVR